MTVTSRNTSFVELFWPHVVIKYIFPFVLAIDLVSDWDERTKWDKTFDGISFLDQMADFKLLKW